MSAETPTGGRRAGVGVGASTVHRDASEHDTVDLTRLEAGEALDVSLFARALFEGITQPVALLDCRGPDPVYEAVNPAYERLTARPSAELTGRSVSDVFPRADTPDGRNVVASVLASGQPHVDEYVVHTPKGTQRIRTTLVPVGGAGGANRLLVVMDDRTAIDQAHAALASSEQRFVTLADASPAGIFATDAEGRWTYVNDKLRTIAQRPDTDLLGHGWRRVTHAESEERVNHFLHESMVKGEAGPERFRIIRPDGSLRWVEIRTSALVDDGRRVGWVGTAQDVSDEVEAQSAADQVTAILAETSDLVGVSGTDGYFRWLNDACRRYHGIEGDVVEARLHVTDIYTEWARRKFVREVLPSLERHGRWSGEMALTSRSDAGELHVLQSIVAHRDAHGEIESYSSIARDITERKGFEEQLAHHALHDPLTGLPNRALFMDRVGQALGRAAGPGHTVAVLSIDLDRFKVVNDSLGHDAGDHLVRAVAYRLASAIRATDTIARLSGDEFAVLCEEAPTGGIETAQRIENALSAPFVLEDGEIFMSASIGVAATQTPATTAPESLLRDADAAMYRAKERGRARYEVVDERLRARALARTETESALRHALERDDLVVHFQPLVSLADGDVVGVEALARWRHPDRGLLLPGDFIPVAEEAGLIVALGENVLRRACTQMAEWRESRPAWDPTLWVNLSARQLNHVTLFPMLRDALDQARLSPRRLGLEITESVLMEDAEATVSALGELKTLGVGVAIDDFGTGYSSLSYLKRFPVTTLKVDRSFVEGLGRDPQDDAIVGAQITMAHALGIAVIAEGVEAPHQLERLRELGCDYAQGYLFAPPLPAAAVDEMLDLDPRW